MARAKEEEPGLAAEGKTMRWKTECRAGARRERSWPKGTTLAPERGEALTALAKDLRLGLEEVEDQELSSSSKKRSSSQCRLGPPLPQRKKKTLKE